MNNLENLPIEILNQIIFNYLSVNDITNCLLTCKQLHVLTNNQLYIYRNALKGYKHCLEHFLMNSIYLLNRHPTTNILSQNLNYHFVRSCENGKFEMARYLYSLDHSYNTYTYEEAFINACRNGHLEIMKWIYGLDSAIDIHVDMERPFRDACEYGYLEIVKYLYEVGLETEKINIHILSECPFRWASGAGNLDIVKYLLSLDRIDIHAPTTSILERNYAFKYSCYNGHLETAKFLYDMGKNKINIHENGEQIFRECCKKNRLEIIKFLFSIDNKINVRVHNEDAFLSCCQNNYLELAKFLYSMDPTIDIHVQNNKAYKFVILNGPCEFFKWLVSLDNSCEIVLDSSNRIIGFYMKMYHAFNAYDIKN